MKQAILIGFLHMNLGNVLAVINCIWTKDYYRVFGHVLPQILFSFLIFGYLSFLIILKWTTLPKDFSILNLVISMVLQGGDSGEEVFPFQMVLQKYLLLGAVTCILWNFFSLPIYKLLSFHTFSFSDVLMHQLIDTIEFVLGSISNTASYLRLWALSLAHSQLSHVLWRMLIESCMHNALLLFVGFAIWFLSTMIILVLMEGLSAFLHSLRLQWVEFNGRFFKGDGNLFQPYCSQENPQYKK